MMKSDDMMSPAAYLALHVKTGDRAGLMDILTDYFSDDAAVTRVERQHIYNPETCRVPLDSLDTDLTLLVLTSSPPGWQTIYYNTISPVEELAAYISKRLESIVIVAMEVEAEGGSLHYLGLYEEGRRERTLRYENGRWTEAHGEPLTVEEGIPELRHGHTSKHSLLDRETMRRFCAYFGLPYREREDDSEERICYSLSRIDVPADETAGRGG